MICPRQGTTEQLAKILDAKKLVHIRGTPACGKTTFAYLLKRYYIQKGVPVVYVPTWPKKGDKIKCINHLLTHVQDAGYPISFNDLIDANIVLILDEAQMSYHDSDLWVWFIKFEAGRSAGPRICVFASYGSPTTGAPENGSSTPGYIPVGQRISITISKLRGSPQISVFYTRTEFDDLIQRSRNNEFDNLPLNEAAADYIFSMTNRNPGAVGGILDILREVAKKEHQIFRALDNVAHDITGNVWKLSCFFVWIERGGS